MTEARALQGTSTGSLLMRRLRFFEPIVHQAALPLRERCVEDDHMIVTYLTFLHQVVRASVPLMEAALAQCTLRPGSLHRDLGSFLERHIHDEQAHDAWLLADLAVAGLTAEEVLNRRPSPSVAEMVGAQYYYAFHVDPIAILGYMCALECFPPSGPFVAEVEQRSGLPSAAFRTLREHSVVDLEHGRQLLELVDCLRFPSTEFHLVAQSGMGTLERIVESLECLARPRDYAGTS
jgi:hypothetical protein